MPHRERAPLPWIRFWFDDFFNDPNVVRMGDRWIGAYLRLIHAAWISPVPGHLPNDDDYLRALSRCSTEEWNECRAVVQRAFNTSSAVANGEGEWIQERVIREYEYQKGYRAQKSAAGTASAEARVQRAFDARSTSRVEKTREEKIESLPEPHRSSTPDTESSNGRNGDESAVKISDSQRRRQDEIGTARIAEAERQKRALEAHLAAGGTS